MPNPYYVDPSSGITIYHGDCREILPQLPEASVDLILTDPPYGVDWEGRNESWKKSGFTKIQGDGDLQIMEAVMTFSDRLLKMDRHAYYFCSADETVGDVCRMLPANQVFRRLMVWDKMGPGLGDLERDYGHQWEAIIYAMKGDRKLLCEGRPVDIFRYAKGGRDWVHPTQKPIGLIHELIGNSSNPGELVLDPCMGSGTTLRAAKDLGRRAIGCDVEEKYCEVAANRLRQEVLPGFDV